MVATGKIALPEHWTELSAARIQRQRCADDIDAIKQTCLAECGHRHVVDCEKCFPKTLDRMRARYCEAEGREWFSQRRAFLNELDTLFTDVKDHKIDLRSIEDRIEAEKEAWYRWVLRMYPQFLSAADSGADQDELRAMLDDPDRSREELIERIWEGVGKPADWPVDVDTLTDRVEAVKNNGADLKQLYMAFFKDQQTGEVLEHAQKYLDAYASSESMPLEEVIDRITQDRKASLSSQPQRDNHRRRLDELRRARTAFEHKQDMARAQASQTPVVAEELYDLPPCAVCGGAADQKNVLSCSLCQAVTHLGGHKRLTVYCSDECFHKGHEEHTEKEHDCEAGERCAQNYDEDIEMEDGESQAVLCRDCIEEKAASLFCTERCAAANLPRHIEDRHGKTAVDEVKTLAVPLLELLEKRLKESNPGLKISLAE
ncbi:hypothetical protein ACHAPT_012709 [Fusarium lateritium]